MPTRYVIFFSSFALLVTAILITRTDSAPLYKLRERVSGISNTSEWLNTKQAIEGLENQVKRTPDNNELKLKLAQAYIQEGRVTGDHNYYDALAFSLITTVLKKEPENFEALCCRATLEASAHQFIDALATSEKAIAINPYNAYIYGVMCDAYVELGKYPEAIKTADKMVNIRPDIRSYSRVSYLREIHGNYPGAIEAMQLALSAGYPGLEQTEWVRVYLGRLYENTGDLKKAKELYKESLVLRENYAPALAGMGSVAKSQMDYSSAISFYTKANSILQDYSFQQHLGELYELTGNKIKSKECFDKAIEMLVKHKHPTGIENGIGHNIDRELAMVFTSMGDYENAYKSAMTEYERRPDNIDVGETLAWASFKLEKYKEAQYYIYHASRTNSSNAEFLCKAGIIYSKNNHPLVAQQCINKAVQTNPHLNKELLIIAKQSNTLADVSKKN